MMKTIESMKNNKHISRLSFSLMFLLLIVINGFSSKAEDSKEKLVPSVRQGSGGRLTYSSDALGNRVVDFSYCGYKASEQAIPSVPVRIVVPAKDGDATLRIQSALDYVATLPLDKDGFRGAVLLDKGIHYLEGGLKINASGVILRGCGVRCRWNYFDRYRTRSSYVDYLFRKERQNSFS